ncbi:MAG: ATP synthase subunit C [Candidatus Hecatellaceae archaeon]
MKHGKLLFALVLAVVLATALSMGCALAAEEEAAAAVTSQKTIDFGMLSLGAGLAIGIAGFGAGIGLGMGVSSIAAAGVERPELIGRFFIYIVFIEAIAIYALIVAIFIIMMLPGAF